MLVIKRNNSVLIDGEPVDFNTVKKREFTIANLWTETVLEEGLNLNELAHFFFEVKDFVFEYFSEYYESTRALISMGNLINPASSVKIYKILTIEDENEEQFVFITCNIDFVFDPAGSTSVGGLEVVSNNNLVDDENNLNKKAKVKFCLMDYMTILFDELPYILKNQTMLC